MRHQYAIADFFEWLKSDEGFSGLTPSQAGFFIALASLSLTNQAFTHSEGLSCLISLFGDTPELRFDFESILKARFHLKENRFYSMDVLRFLGTLEDLSFSTDDFLEGRTAIQDLIC